MTKTTKMTKTLEVNDDLYTALELLAHAHGVSTSAFAQLLLSTQLEGFYRGLSATCRRDLRAFHRELPRLLQSHEGEYAAFYNGALVATSKDRSRLLREMQERYGGDEVFITRITPKMRVWHIPYWRRVR